jgi:hypothetical protein
MLSVIELSTLMMNAYKLSYTIARLEFCSYGFELKFEWCGKAILKSRSKFVTRTKPKSLNSKRDWNWIILVNQCCYAECCLYFECPHAKLSTLMLSTYKLSYTIARLEFCSYSSEFKFESCGKTILSQFQNLLQEQNQNRSFAKEMCCYAECCLHFECPIG